MWKNKIEIWKRITLDEFKDKYDKINDADDRFVTASQLFPIAGEFTYDVVIYYKQNMGNKDVS